MMILHLLLVLLSLAPAASSRSGRQAPATPSTQSSIPALPSAPALAPRLGPAGAPAVNTPVLGAPGAPSVQPAAAPSAMAPRLPLVPQAPAVNAPEAPLLPTAEAPVSRAAEPAAAPESGSGSQLGGRLDERFRELEAAFGTSRDDLSEGNSKVPDAQRAAIIGRVRARLDAQLAGMRAANPDSEPLLKQVEAEGRALLSEIDTLMEKGEIDPRGRIRAGAEEAPAPIEDRELRVGVYPVAADPFQWGHLLIALRAIAAFRLDKVVFVLAGDDPRKPTMTKVDFRHPMGKAVLEEFAPFFQYSSIAVGTDYDGETNIFRILELNGEQRMQGWYLVGGDHYRLTDKKGNPDTLPKLERNMKDPALGFAAQRHALKVAFIKRDGGEESVPTSLDVHFLPEVPFEASSTLVRQGNHGLMPYAAYDYVRKNRPGLYGIEAEGSGAR